MFALGALLVFVAVGGGRPQIAAAQGQPNTRPSVTAPQAAASYVGSAACRECHAPIYERWSKTRMANVVLNPKEHPEAITPDLSKSDPLVTFKKEDIAFVYGSKWKQRYFTRVG